MLVVRIDQNVVSGITEIMEECTERISICSDSHSLLKAIQSGAHDTQSIRQRLDKREGPATLIWVPGHNGLPGKEAAGELAKTAATATNTPPQPISFATAKARIRCTVTNPPSNKPRTAMVNEHFSWKADCSATSSRADAVLLARLRAGHTPLLKAYAHLLDPAADPTATTRALSSANIPLVGLRPIRSPHDRPREGAGAR